jgi:hypothetical protein
MTTPTWLGEWWVLRLPNAPIWGCVSCRQFVLDNEAIPPHRDGCPVPKLNALIEQLGEVVEQAAEDYARDADGRTLEEFYPACAAALAAYKEGPK